MKRQQPANLAASVHRRLLNLSRAKGEDFNFLLVRFAIERLLHRLAQSRYADQFVLKGALLFLVWDVPVHRPTRDLDLLGFGDGAAEQLASVFREICQMDVVPDGLVFDPKTVQVRPIREEQAYGGQRISLTARLGRARIPTRIDVGYGDVIVPASVETTYPTLLDFPAPQIRVYSREAVIAEKVHAMVILDMTNSRMKDFYDLWTLARLFQFDGDVLMRAIASTFERRQTQLPQSVPVALTAEFSGRHDKITQWQAFVRRNRIEVDVKGLPGVVAELSVFLRPLLQAAVEGRPFSAIWDPGGPWAEVSQR
ncbi:MAG: nucleotidyl transferase AbiEii/AbiGii toxin family protein [Chloroflexi bacterium]|nr:nucleotidyl transferase AbiEii/AbiGii toxin family protein [Chloroflexota bacterium]